MKNYMAAFYINVLKRKGKITKVEKYGEEYVVEVICEMPATYDQHFEYVASPNRFDCIGVWPGYMDGKLYDAQ